MKLSNLTPYPALAYKGVDQLEQAFHVVVMRQTYNWNDKGLLVLADEQDPLRFTDQLVDSQDTMSGVIEESDLAHYKPKCDVIIKGHAYTPPYRKNHSTFTAGIKLQTPSVKLDKDNIQSSKYLFTSSQDNSPENTNYRSGKILINKTLTLSAPRFITNDNFSGSAYYKLKKAPLGDKVSLNPHNSFGGYCMIEETHPSFYKIDKEELIPENDRQSIRINPHHDPLAYLEQDNYNPAGKGFTTETYLKNIQPLRIQLPQVYNSNFPITDSEVFKVAKQSLDPSTHSKLVAGFGVRAKTHPDRSKFVGTVDEMFINSDKQLPEGFDFAMWNCAYPDQQTDFLKGNECITLTNFCKPSTPAATVTDKGDCQLNLYLPRSLPYLELEPTDSTLIATELPMRLDTVVVSPDQTTVNLVWRAVVVDNYNPKSATLVVLDSLEQDELLKELLV